MNRPGTFALAFNCNGPSGVSSVMEAGQRQSRPTALSAAAGSLYTFNEVFFSTAS
jgi:hypothetical protein